MYVCMYVCKLEIQMPASFKFFLHKSQISYEYYAKAFDQQIHT
jgi:hypothetical protein